jgi:hypothetical protein
MKDKLIKVQQELKAPKNQFNKFGNYKYRSLEDILEAVKPLLHKNGIEMTLTDECYEVAGLPVIKASAILSDGENEIVRSAVSGVDIKQKGMAIPQTFGSASSYARKYLLNGIFLIDDTKDDDATNKHDKTAPVTSKLITLEDNSAEFVKATSFMKKGGTIAQIKSKYSMSTEVENKLIQSTK